MDLSLASASILTALAGDGKAPEWIMLLPAGSIKAVDGREWSLDDAEAVAVASAEAGLELPIDWEHAADISAPKGERAPAAGWIEKLEARAGALWAKVAWTDQGRADIESRAYRYISPAFLHDKAGRIAKLIGAGLVNRPAIATLPALAGQTPGDTMDKDLLDALGLAGSATKAEAITAIGKLKGDLTTALAAAQAPDATKFVPKADLEQALARATTAEEKLGKIEMDTAEAKAVALVDKAVTDGKIAPASKDHYLGLARKDFASVESLLGSLPTLTPAQKTDLDKAPPAPAGKLTAEEKAIASQLGVSEEDFIKARAA